MSWRRARILALAGLLVASSTPAPRAAAPSPELEMDRLVRSGIDGIYRMEFDQAEADFRKLQALIPGNPYADFGLLACPRPC